MDDDRNLEDPRTNDLVPAGDNDVDEINLADEDEAAPPDEENELEPEGPRDALVRQIEDRFASYCDDEADLGSGVRISRMANGKIAISQGARIIMVDKAGRTLLEKIKRRLER